MLNATFEMLIPHYIMEYVGNLCSPCPLHEQLNGEFIGHTNLPNKMTNLCVCKVSWLIHKKSIITGLHVVWISLQYI